MKSLASPGGLTSGPGARRTSWRRAGTSRGILPKTLFGGHDADLGVTGARPGKGEAAEGSVVRRSCSNPLTCFAHVDRCALPGIGELACMMILHTLTDLALQFGRCKTRAKMVAIQDSGGGIQKAGSLDFEIDFEFSCRTFSLWSKTGEFCGSPHLSGRFRARVHAACSLHTCMLPHRCRGAMACRHRPPASPAA